MFESKVRAVSNNADHTAERSDLMKVYTVDHFIATIVFKKWYKISKKLCT